MIGPPRVYPISRINYHAKLWTWDGETLLRSKAMIISINIRIVLSSRGMDKTGVAESRIPTQDAQAFWQMMNCLMKSYLSIIPKVLALTNKVTFHF